jgi:RNA polymerase sigma factor (sigma-70 family)
MIPNGATQGDQAVPSSFDETMKRLRDGDPEASRQVFNRYVNRLVALAGQRLGPQIRQKEDPEDVVQSVFRSFFERYGAGSLNPHDWESLWAMLAMITARKCGARARYYHAERRDVDREAAAAAATESQSGDAWDPGDAAPTPEEEAVLHDTIQELLASFTETKHQQIILLTLEGLPADEVSARVPCTERMVHRVLVRVRDWLLRHGREQAP